MVIWIVTQNNIEGEWAMTVELDLVFRKLIEQKVKYQSDNLGLNLLISRLQRKYAGDPSNEVLDGCVQEMNAFFSKYEKILQNETEKLKTL